MVDIKTININKIVLIFCAILCFSCGEDNSCLKSSGREVYSSFELDAFTNLDIPAGVEVEIIPFSDYKIEIDSYENRIENIVVKNVDKTLVIENNMGCTLVHEYKSATLRIYTPTLDTIFSRTQFTVRSREYLTYPNLYIKTSLANNASSSFDLKIKNEQLEVEDNLVGYFKMVGETQYFNVLLYGGNGVVDARNFHAQKIHFYHRSTSNIYLYPTEEIQGTIASTGNAQLFYCPNKIQIDHLYKGVYECIEN